MMIEQMLYAIYLKEPNWVFGKDDGRYYARLDNYTLFLDTFTNVVRAIYLHYYFPEKYKLHLLESE